MKPRRIVRTEDEIDRVVVTAGGARETNLDLGLFAYHVPSVTPEAHHPRRFTSTSAVHPVIAMYTAIPIVTLESHREGESEARTNEFQQKSQLDTLADDLFEQRADRGQASLETCTNTNHRRSWF